MRKKNVKSIPDGYHSVTPYLSVRGASEAIDFYKSALGAKVDMIMHFKDAPPEVQAQMSPQSKDKIMHARMSIDGEVIMASDAPPSHFQKAQGFAVSITVSDPADGERKFKALLEGGSINMPFGKTFFSKGFGMGVDQFGIPWMVNCPLDM